MNPFTLTPSDLSALISARDKRAKRLAKWIASHQNSSQIEAARNPRHARMLVATDPAKCVHSIPEPVIESDSNDIAA